MKKVLVIGLNLEIGGAERALLGLLDSFDYLNYKVDLFLQRHVGELMQFIPPKVNLLKEVEEYTTLAVPLKDIIKKGHIKHAFGRVVGKMKAKLYSSLNKSTLPSAVGIEYSHKYTRKFMPKISDEEYDLVISFCSPHYFAFEKTNAKLKIAWIHTDYSSISIDVKSELKMWDKFDYIISISSDCTKSFCEVFPTLKNKIRLIENIQSVDFIKQQSKDFSVDDEMPILEDGFNLLSIGRFCTAKNFDNVPSICKKIREKGINIKWYLIGYGGMETLIKEKIKEEKMEDYVIVLGKKGNPYPYIKQCDLYVQPSRYEGKAVAVREAQSMGKAVAISNFKTAPSQLENDVDGIIVPMDNEGCAEGIAELLNSKDKLENLSTTCKTRDYSNSEEINKIYDLMEENDG